MYGYILINLHPYDWYESINMYNLLSDHPLFQAAVRLTNANLAGKLLRLDDIQIQYTCKYT